MMFSKKHLKYIFLTSTIVLLLACSLLGSVSAQGGGGGPLKLDPKFGPPGTEIEVTFDITNSDLREYASLYNQLTYSLVLDLGGTNLAPSLDTVRTATWQVIGQAGINNGQLHGIATIPEDTATGEHLITAVYYDQSSDAPYNYFWEWFEVKSEPDLVSSMDFWLLVIILAAALFLGITVTLVYIRYYKRKHRHDGTA